MPSTTSRHRVRLHTIRLDKPGDCFGAPRLHQTIAALRNKLSAVQAENVVLTKRVEHLVSIARNQNAVRRTAVSFITRHELLTRRERQVLLLFMERPNDKEVAARLGTQLQTVRNQVRSIQNKLGVKSRAEMIVSVYRGQSRQGRNRS